MLKEWTLGLGPALLPLGAVGAVALASGQGAGKARVVCCGECMLNDNCLAKRKVEGEVRENAEVNCCRNCEKGDDYLEKCAPKRSCCEAK